MAQAIEGPWRSMALCKGAQRHRKAHNQARNSPEIRPQTAKPVATPFSHLLIHEESRLMIRSTCQECGASKVVSSADGSLDDWEDGHRCQPTKPDQAQGSKTS